MSAMKCKRGRMRCKPATRSPRLIRLHTLGYSVPRPAARCVDEIGVATMCLTHRTTEPIGLPRIQDQVHVVWHQAVSPHFHVRLASLLPKKIAVNLLIAVFKENRLSTIATLITWSGRPDTTMRAKRVMSENLTRTILRE